MTEERYFAQTIGGLIQELDDGLELRPTPMILTANSPSSLQSKCAMEELMKTGSAAPRCPQNGFSNGEQADPGFSKERYLVVGVFPYINSLTAVQSGAHPMSDRVHLFHVVTPVLHEIPDRQPRLYILVDIQPGTQRYNAYPISIDDVYFFSEYRTDARTVKYRRSEWIKQVLEAAVVPSVEPEPANLLHATSRFEALQRVLERNPLVSLEENPIDCSINFIWEHFLDPMSGNELTLANAEQLAVEVLRRWPTLQRHNVTAEKLIRLRRGILESGSTVGWDRAYGLLALGCESPLDSPDLGELVIGFLDTVDKIQRNQDTIPRFVKDMVLRKLADAIDVSISARINSEDAARMLETPDDARLYNIFELKVVDTLARSDTICQTYARIRDILLEYGFQSGREHGVVAGQMQDLIGLLHTVRTALMD